MAACINCQISSYAPFTLQAVRPVVRSFSRRRNHPRSPNFVRVVHTTGTQPLIGQGFLTINNSRMTVLQTCGKLTNMLTHLMSPCYTERRPNHNLMYTVGHTFSYCSQKFIHACAKSSAHAHGTKIRGGIFKRFKTFLGCAR